MKRPSSARGPSFDAAKAPVIVALAREQIGRQDTTELLGALLSMTTNAAAVREYAGSLVIAIDGYDDDPAELYAIPEVRKFIQKVDDSFPFWFHYCSKVDNTLFILMLCLMPLGNTVTENGVASTRLAPGALSELISKLFESMNELYERQGLSKAERSETTRQVGEYLQAYF